MTAVLALMLAGSLALTGCPKTTGDDDPDTLNSSVSTSGDPDTLNSPVPISGDPELSGAITIKDGTNPVTSSYTDTPLTAVYTGDEGVTFQWNKGGTPIDGKTGTAYTPDKWGSYTVTVSLDGYPSKTSAAVAVTDIDFGTEEVTLYTISSKANFEAAETAIETAGGGNYVLTITDTVDVEGESIELAEDAIVSLRGGGTLHQSTASVNGLFALINQNSKLILRDAVLQGHAGNSSGLVKMDETVEFVMYGGTITGNTATYLGGGVDVGNGTFTMNGGTISDNTAQSGGGVFVSGTFTMNGGTISGNTANRGGGVFVEWGTFTKTGGTIYGDNDTTNTPPQNTATDGATGKGHAVFVYDNSVGHKYRDDTAEEGHNISTIDYTGLTAVPAS
ncbi:hypothetical protein AGMMS49942_03380 [Spirochaetia bacterium]|nr:hypothetical protein AGMMS49942_03380 [Spirochaetia bacterium]